MDAPMIVGKPGEGRSVSLGGMGVVFKVSGADTGGAFAVVEKERHRKVAQIEQPRVDAISLLEVSQNPVRGLFRETALAGASNNDGNDGHTFDPCCWPERKRGACHGTQVVSRRRLGCASSARCSHHDGSSPASDGEDGGWPAIR
jgi:hypothetical protein